MAWNKLKHTLFFCKTEFLYLRIVTIWCTKYMQKIGYNLIWIKNLFCKLKKAKWAKMINTFLFQNQLFFAAINLDFWFCNIFSKVAAVDYKMLRNFLGASFQTLSFSVLKTSNLSAYFPSSWNCGQVLINDCMSLKKKFLFLGKKEQIFKIASQSCATPMPLHTQNLKIWFFSPKNENLSDLLKFSTCFDLLWLLWLQTEANWSFYKIF